jgi:hypothetical protein
MTTESYLLFLSKANYWIGEIKYAKEAGASDSLIEISREAAWQQNQHLRFDVKGGVIRGLEPVQEQVEARGRSRPRAINFRKLL